MSRFLDERGRIFAKVNVVDIIAAVALIVLVMFGLTRIHSGSSATIPLGVTFRVQQVRKDTVNNLLQARGTLKDDSGTVLGTVEKVTAQPSEEEVLSPLTGKLQVQKSPLFQDVDITVRAKAVTSGGLIRIGGESIAVGKKLVLVGMGTPSFEESATIQSLQPR